MMTLLPSPTPVAQRPGLVTARQQRLGEADARKQRGGHTRETRPGGAQSSDSEAQIPEGRGSGCVPPSCPQRHGCVGV